MFVTTQDEQAFLKAFKARSREAEGWELVAEARYWLGIADGRPLPLVSERWFDEEAWGRAFSVAGGLPLNRVRRVRSYSFRTFEGEFSSLPEGNTSLSWWMVRRLPMGPSEERIPSLPNFEGELRAAPLYRDDFPGWPGIVRYSIADLFGAATSCAWRGEPEYGAFMALLQLQHHAPIVAFNGTSGTLHVVIA